MLDALVNDDFYNVWVRQPTPQNLPYDEERYTDPKYRDLLERCLGALDGTHVPANPPEWELAA